MIDNRPIKQYDGSMKNVYWIDKDDPPLDQSKLQIGDLMKYVSPISGCTVVTHEWCGVAGWAFISND